MIKVLTSIAVTAAATIALSVSSLANADVAPPPDSPLTDYLGFGYNQKAEDALYTAQEASRQVVIADCMRAVGFNYTPVGTDLAETGNATNLAYLRSLTKRDEKSYIRTLTGRDGSEGWSESELQRRDVDRDGIIEPSETNTLGCLGLANRSVRGVYDVRGFLANELRQLDDDIESQPAVKDASTSWVTCMNRLGIGGTSVSTVTRAFAEALIAGTQVDPEGTERCNAAIAKARNEAAFVLEREFFRDNRAVIERYAFPAP